MSDTNNNNHDTGVMATGQALTQLAHLPNPTAAEVRTAVHNIVPHGAQEHSQTAVTHAHGQRITTHVHYEAGKPEIITIRERIEPK